MWLGSKHTNTKTCKRAIHIVQLRSYRWRIRCQDDSSKDKAVRMNCLCMACNFILQRKTTSFLRQCFLSCRDTSIWCHLLAVTWFFQRLPNYHLSTCCNLHIAIYMLQSTMLAHVQDQMPMELQQIIIPCGNSFRCATAYTCSYFLLLLLWLREL